MALSPNAVFHFTEFCENLDGILKNDFHPKYCMEDYGFMNHSGETFERAVPMVSFCDIPLSQMKEHMEVYGYYGLGMRKTWAMEIGASPIIYSYHNAMLSLKVNESMIHLLKLQESEKNDAGKTLLSISSYLKAYEGNISRKGKVTFKRFYDEREWRVIPNASHFGLKMMLSKEEFEDSSKEKMNAILSLNARVAFNADDIRYIIVKDEAEVMPLVREIEGMNTRFAEDKIKALVSRVISSEQILEDF